MGPLIRHCVKPFSSTLCHVEVLKSPFARDGGPLLPCPPSNGCQWWAQNLPPFLLIASGDAMATRREQKSGSPHHSMCALASMAKHLKFSISVCQRRDNWEGFNVEPPSPLLLLFFYALYPHAPPPLMPPQSPPLTEASSLHCYGSKCEAVIKLWLLCFKGLALSQSSPPCYQPESGSVRIPFQPAQTKTNWTNNHHSLEIPLKNSGIRSAHGMATLLRHRRTKGRLFGDWIKWRTMWVFVEKSLMTGSVGNLDITGTEWYVRDWFQWLNNDISQRGGGTLKKKTR